MKIVQVSITFITNTPLEISTPKESLHFSLKILTLNR